MFLGALPAGTSPQRVWPFSGVYGQPHELLCSLPWSIVFPRGQFGKNQPRGRAETGIETGSRDSEANVLDRSVGDRTDVAPGDEVRLRMLVLLNGHAHASLCFHGQ